MSVGHGAFWGYIVGCGLHYQHSLYCHWRLQVHGTCLISCGCPWSMLSLKTIILLFTMKDKETTFTMILMTTDFTVEKEGHGRLL